MDIVKALKKRDLEEGGAVQKYIDSETIRLMDPYTPFRQGTLKNAPSGQSTIGTGRIIQQTPYARRLYYNPQYNFNEAPNRGAFWFERMKNASKNDILKGAAKIVGVKYED